MDDKSSSTAPTTTPSTTSTTTSTSTTATTSGGFLNHLKQHKWIYLCALIIIVISIFGVLRYAWNRKYNPILLNEPIRGVVYGNSTTNRTMTDEQSADGIPLPDAKLHNKIPSLGENRNLSFYLWIYPENQTDNFLPYNTSSLQSILQWGENFYLMYEPLRNELVLKVHVLVQPDHEYQEFRISNCLLLQKWNMVLFSIDNRYIDIYINGSLYRSILLYNVPFFEEDGWYLYRGKGFIGSVTAIRYFNYTLNDLEAQQLYNAQYSTSTPSNGYWWWLWHQNETVKLIVS